MKKTKYSVGKYSLDISSSLDNDKYLRLLYWLNTNSKENKNVSIKINQQRSNGVCVEKYFCCSQN